MSRIRHLQGWLIHLQGWFQWQWSINHMDRHSQWWWEQGPKLNRWHYPDNDGGPWIAVATQIFKQQWALWSTISYQNGACNFWQGVWQNAQIQKNYHSPKVLRGMDALICQWVWTASTGNWHLNHGHRYNFLHHQAGHSCWLTARCNIP